MDAAFARLVQALPAAEAAHEGVIAPGREAGAGGDASGFGEEDFIKPAQTLAGSLPRAGPVPASRLPARRGFAQAFSRH